MRTLCRHFPGAISANSMALLFGVPFSPLATSSFLTGSPAGIFAQLLHVHLAIVSTPFLQVRQAVQLSTFTSGNPICAVPATHPASGIGSHLRDIFLAVRRAFQTYCFRMLESPLSRIRQVFRVFCRISFDLSPSATGRSSDKFGVSLAPCPLVGIPFRKIPLPPAIGSLLLLVGVPLAPAAAGGSKFVAIPLGPLLLRTLFLLHGA